MDKYEGEDILSLMDSVKNYNRFLLKAIVKYIQPQQKIVDFGAGNGFFASAIKYYFTPPHNCCNTFNSNNLQENKTDIDLLCVEPAKNMHRYLYDKKLNFVTSLNEIINESVDFIYTLNVLEHIKDDASIIELLRQKLKPQGKILVYVPAGDLLFSSADKRVGHYRRYSHKKLLALFTVKKWNIEKAIYADFLGFFAALLFKYIGSDKGEVSKRQLQIFDFTFPLSRVVDHLTFGKLRGKNLLLVAEKK